ncbi:helix-turn-helix domain-containing protein [Halobacillus litoralis]|uniref:helix-turn-helix domain-containing protein n=1 Tax=Halobacillus litoralis TaxID=45668 RepID=UPI001CD227FC|nr:helix-turn-helix domain-containing protein [Halobacillus litoralis]MCA1022132.1 helix-turn-helix domain-containing protein [Halobacillus litoralis]
MHEKTLDSYSEVLNVEDIQTILSIGRKQAYDLVNSDAFHSIRIGKRIKVSKNVFEKWLTGEGINNEY